MRYLVVIVVALASTGAFADESRKPNPWDSYNRPTNQFNSASPKEPIFQPLCRDQKNCIHGGIFMKSGSMLPGRERSPERMRTPANPAPGNLMPNERR